MNEWKMYNILMLIKRGPSKFTSFVENEYRHEHVMITNLYILSHILHDCHLYHINLLRILWRSLSIHLYSHPHPCGTRHHCSTSRRSDSGNVAAGKEYMPCTRLSRISQRWAVGDGLEILRYGITRLQTVPCYIAGIVLL